MGLLRTLGITDTLRDSSFQVVRGGRLNGRGWRGEEIRLAAQNNSHQTGLWPGSAFRCTLSLWKVTLWGVWQ